MKKLVLLMFLAVTPAFAEEAGVMGDQKKDFSPEYMSQIEPEKKHEIEQSSEEKQQEHQRFLRDLARVERGSRR